MDINRSNSHINGSLLTENHNNNNSNNINNSSASVNNSKTTSPSSPTRKYDEGHKKTNIITNNDQINASSAVVVASKCNGDIVYGVNDALLDNNQKSASANPIANSDRLQHSNQAIDRLAKNTALVDGCDVINSDFDETVRIRVDRNDDEDDNENNKLNDTNNSSLVNAISSSKPLQPLLLLPSSESSSLVSVPQKNVNQVNCIDESTEEDRLLPDNNATVIISSSNPSQMDDRNRLDSRQYNDYINQTYEDTSRRPSVQNDDESQSERVRLLIEPASPVNIAKTASSNVDKITNLSSKLTFIENTNEKMPRSIVKSPSSNSFNKNHKEGRTRNRLSFQSSKTGTGTATEDQGSDESGECERPVLHVQFMPPDDHEESLSDRRSTDCKSPIGSLTSRSGSETGSNSSSSSSSTSSSSDDDASSIGQFAEARAPDGGWGWVIVFASFMVNLIADGITFSFGVIFVEFLNYFGESKAKTAWIGSLFMAIPLLSGPIASFLTDRYGCRKVTIAGSILASTGFILSSFANSMEMLCFTFGILAGFGLSLCYVTAVVIVAYYFEKRRSFATGLSVCGSGIGTFIFAPLTHTLLDEYGWRGTTLILAGIFLNMMVCGMLMRDLEWTTQRAKLKRKGRKRSKLGVSADSFSVSNSTNTGGTASNLNQQQSADGGPIVADINGGELEDLSDPRLFSSLITLPTFVKNGEKVPVEVLELLSTHRNVHDLLVQNYPGLLYSRSCSEPHSSYTGIAASDGPLSPSNPEHPSKINKKKIQTNTEQFHNQQALLTWLRKNEHHHHHHHRDHGVAPPSSSYLKDLRMHRHSLTYRGAMLNINRYRLRASSCPDIYRNSMTTIAKEESQWQQGIAEFKSLFVDILDFSYFTDIRFLLFAISNLLLYAWYDVPYVYLTDNAIEMGIPETDASMLIGIIGIVNMFGEIALGWMGDRKGINPSVVYAICMGMCGLIIALVPASNSYTWLCVCAGLFGFCIAANYSLTSIILVELITLERFTNAYGLLLLVQGIANLVGPPLAGWIYDITGTYNLSFYLAGVFIILSGAILIILPALGKYRKYRSLKRRTPSIPCETPSLPSDQPIKKCNGNSLPNCYSDVIIKDSVKPNHV